jgi:hypothetical protein
MRVSITDFLLSITNHVLIKIKNFFYNFADFVLYQLKYSVLFPTLYLISV